MLTTTGETTRLIDAYTGDSMGTLRPPPGSKRIGQACYTPDGSMVITGDDTGYSHLYDAKRASQVFWLFEISYEYSYLVGKIEWSAS